MKLIVSAFVFLLTALGAWAAPTDARIGSAQSPADYSVGGVHAPAVSAAAVSATTHVVAGASRGVAVQSDAGRVVLTTDECDLDGDGIVSDDECEADTTLSGDAYADECDDEEDGLRVNGPVINTGDGDDDDDGVCDCHDNCASEQNSDQSDRDHDGVGDECDVCPDDANCDQEDGDDDGIGDACEPVPTPPSTWGQLKAIYR